MRAAKVARSGRIVVQRMAVKDTIIQNKNRDRSDRPPRAFAGGFLFVPLLQCAHEASGTRKGCAGRGVVQSCDLSGNNIF